jgi:hypothetical protein
MPTFRPVYSVLKPATPVKRAPTTIRYTDQLGKGNVVAVEGKPRLVVEFFDTRI